MPTVDDLRESLRGVCDDARRNLGAGGASRVAMMVDDARAAGRRVDTNASTGQGELADGMFARQAKDANRLFALLKIADRDFPAHVHELEEYVRDELTSSD